MTTSLLIRVAYGVSPYVIDVEALEGHSVIGAMAYR